MAAWPEAGDAAVLCGASSNLHGSAFFLLSGGGSGLAGCQPVARRAACDLACDPRRIVLGRLAGHHNARGRYELVRVLFFLSYDYDVAKSGFFIWAFLIRILQQDPQRENCDTEFFAQLISFWAVRGRSAAETSHTSGESPSPCGEPLSTGNASDVAESPSLPVPSPAAVTIGYTIGTRSWTPCGVRHVESLTVRPVITKKLNYGLTR